MIQAIYREEKLLKELPSEERKLRRQLSVRPLVEAYFTWAKETIQESPTKKQDLGRVPILDEPGKIPEGVPG